MSKLTGDSWTTIISWLYMVKRDNVIKDKQGFNVSRLGILPENLAYCQKTWRIARKLGVLPENLHFTIIRQRRGHSLNSCFSVFTQVNSQNSWLFIKFYYFCWRLAASRHFPSLFLLGNKLINTCVRVLKTPQQELFLIVQTCTNTFITFTSITTLFIKLEKHYFNGFHWNCTPLGCHFCVTLIYKVYFRQRNHVYQLYIGPFWKQW